MSPVAVFLVCFGLFVLAALAFSVFVIRNLRASQEPPSLVHQHYFPEDRK